MELAIFYFLAALTLIPALLVVTLRNVFHAALWLVLSMVGVAGLYAYMGADFLFVSQLLIYAGGVMVLMLFVVLLSGSPKDWVISAVNRQWAGAIAVAALLLGLTCYVLSRFPAVLWSEPAGPTTAAIGKMLIRDMVIPFEAVSLVLLAALVGAVLFARRIRKGAL
jgi:NADH-quinone oxidoreductase subunit J